ncbi:MAG: VCBS repeat-containing protein [Deltaproteobacteria bacterium]|nr:VCBS repeat-containing protein [Deltaproteobacteria bacterium]
MVQVAGAVAIGDLDNDLKPDIITVTSCNTPSSSFNKSYVKVFWNDGFGNFTKSSYKLELKNAQSVKVLLGDLNNDGFLDPVFVISNLGNIIILANKGKNLENNPIFQSTVTINGEAYNPSLLNVSPKKVLLEDLDRDGDLDLLSLSSNGQAVSVYANKGDMRLYQGDTNGVGKNYYYLSDNFVDFAVGDINKDALSDIVLLGNNEYAKAILSDDGVFTTSFVVQAPSGATRIMIGILVATPGRIWPRFPRHLSKRLFISMAMLVA